MERQRGDMMAVIFAVLVVALMTAVGIIFYQNFAAKKTQDTQQTTNDGQDKADTSIKTKRTAFHSSIYAVDYPQNWTVTVKDVSDKPEDGSVTQFASPDGSVRADLLVSQTAVEPLCEETARIADYSVTSGVVTALADTPLSLVTTTISNPTGGYNYKIGLVPDGGDTHAKVGDTACNVRNVGHVTDVHFSGKDGSRTMTEPTVLATIEFPKLPQTPKPAAKDRQTIKDLMATDSYKIALSILESARKE